MRGTEGILWMRWRFRMAFHVRFVELWETARENSNGTNRTANACNLTARGRSLPGAFRVSRWRYNTRLSAGHRLRDRAHIIMVGWRRCGKERLEGSVSGDECYRILAFVPRVFFVGSRAHLTESYSHETRSQGVQKDFGKDINQTGIATYDSPSSSGSHERSSMRP